MAELFYDVRWSDDCDEKFIDDFNHVQDQVFKGVHDRVLFKHQYIDNIYGPSVLVVVYDGIEPVAARGLWRSDFFGQLAYQTGRVCVLPKYRRFYLVFVKMTKLATALVPEDAILFSFPNQYSFPGYEKLGWYLLYETHLRLFTKTAYFHEHQGRMPSDYFVWWVKPLEKMKYVKFGSAYFLVKKIKPFCSEVVSEVSREVAQQCPKFRGFGIFFYESHKQTFYNKGILPTRLVCNRNDVTYIPKWKIDAI